MFGGIDKNENFYQPESVGNTVEVKSTIDPPNVKVTCEGIAPHFAISIELALNLQYLHIANVTLARL